MLKVGEKCSSGYTVDTILGQSERAAVYTTDNNHLRWIYYDNSGVVPVELSASIAKFETLMLDIKNIVPKARKEDCYLRLGKSLYSALNGGIGEAAIESFRDIEHYIHSAAQKNVRVNYVWQCILIASIYSSLILLVLHNYDIRHKVFFYGSIFGVVGACISVLQRIANMDIDWYMSGIPSFLQALSRVSLAALFGMILVLAVKSDLMLGAFKGDHISLMIFALVAGFSERMIPDLFKRLENKDSENS